MAICADWSGFALGLTAWAGTVPLPRQSCLSRPPRRLTTSRPNCANFVHSIGAVGNCRGRIVLPEEFSHKGGTDGPGSKQLEEDRPHQALHTCSWLRSGQPSSLPSAHSQTSHCHRQDCVSGYSADRQGLYPHLQKANWKSARWPQEPRRCHRDWPQVIGSTDCRRAG